jgi:ribosome maturation factor RimP
MITKEQIVSLVEEALDENHFVVNVEVRPGNIIDIVIDCVHGVNIQKCIDVSRFVESKLDRDTEDFELNVSSAGLTSPFTVLRQYEKNLGRQVEVRRVGEKPLQGTLKQFDAEGFELEVISKEKLEDKKKKVEVTRTHRFAYADGAEVKVIISFK